jgi:hypothetical protein
MKNHIILFFSIFFLQISVFGQVGINTTAAPPHVSAGLDVDFNNKGFLPPRMTTAQRDAIASPAAGLRIYNTTTNCENYFNGTAWFEICGICTPGIPAVPGPISGPTSPCSSASGLTYSISPATNATSYTWVVPTGWSITSGQGSTSITVTSGAIGQNGNISVTSVNPCGTSAATSYPVSVANPNASFTYTPALVTINNPATFTATAAGLDYAWSLQSATPSVATGQSATATWSSAANYQVTLTVTNASGCTASTTQTITVSNCPAPGSQTMTFNYTGSMQTWTVPSCVTQIQFDVSGAKGGNGKLPEGGIGGNGGRVTGTLSVTPGQVLHIYVGGMGGNGVQSQASAGGFNGGGSVPSGGSQVGGGGGGASDIRTIGNTLSDRIVVAGGGGGALCANGGAGGGLIGGNASTANQCGGQSNAAGKGGTQVAGGAGGIYGCCNCQDGNAGSFGIGGVGLLNGVCNGSWTSGGGGGGWYGGGSGTTANAGGAGSSYTAPSVTNVQHQQGVNTGDGSVVFVY